MHQMVFREAIVVQDPKCKWRESLLELGSTPALSPTSLFANDLDVNRR
jgi:hypothetical protein